MAEEKEMDVLNNILWFILGMLVQSLIKHLELVAFERDFINNEYDEEKEE